MTAKLSAWLNPGTIIAIVSSLVTGAMAIGGFAAVSNYRAIQMDKQFETFAKQIEDIKTDTSRKFDKLETRLDGEDAGGRQTIKFEADLQNLTAQVAALANDEKEDSKYSQARIANIYVQLSDLKAINAVNYERKQKDNKHLESTAANFDNMKQDQPRQ